MFKSIKIILSVLTLAASLTAQANICDRTEEIKIVLEGNVGKPCEQILESDLTTITKLDVASAGMQTLKSGDFKGLVALQELDLEMNAFTTLPEDVFQGLNSLQTLWLESNKLVSLPEKIFQNLPNLKLVSLEQNQLNSLPKNIFVNTQLQDISLDTNPLKSLPDFHNLKSLQTLFLGNLELTTVSDGAFIGLDSLFLLDLSSNKIVSLSENVFSEANFQNSSEVLMSENPLDAATQSMLLEQLGERLTY